MIPFGFRKVVVRRGLAGWIRPSMPYRNGSTLKVGMLNVGMWAVLEPLDEEMRPGAARIREHPTCQTCNSVVRCGRYTEKGPGKRHPYFRARDVVYLMVLPCHPTFNVKLKR
jgi:hypothetical protein